MQKEEATTGVDGNRLIGLSLGYIAQALLSPTTAINLIDLKNSEKVAPNLRCEDLKSIVSDAIEVLKLHGLRVELSHYNNLEVYTLRYEQPIL